MTPSATGPTVRPRLCMQSGVLTIKVLGRTEALIALYLRLPERSGCRLADQAAPQLAQRAADQRVGRCLRGAELVGNLGQRVPIAVATEHRGLLVWLQLAERDAEQSRHAPVHRFRAVVAAGRIDKGGIIVQVAGAQPSGTNCCRWRRSFGPTCSRRRRATWNTYAWSVRSSWARRRSQLRHSTISASAATSSASTQLRKSVMQYAAS